MIYLRPEEPARLGAWLGLTEAQFRKRFVTTTAAGAEVIEVKEVGIGCPLLEGDLCSVDEVKPGQCRAYPFWSELVGDRHAWRREKRDCEGIGRGPVWPRDEIERMLRLDPGAPKD